MKHSNEKVLGGALVGAVLGVVAGVILAPESGKEVRNDIQKIYANFYKYIAVQVKKMKAVGEDQYGEYVNKWAKSYAKANKISADEELALVNGAKHSWKQIKKHFSGSQK